MLRIGIAAAAVDGDTCGRLAIARQLLPSLMPSSMTSRSSNVRCFPLLSGMIASFPPGGEARTVILSGFAERGGCLKD